MDYQGNVIRPPSEAESIILQVTVGCPYNRCTFCGAYKGIPFSIKSAEQVEEDLGWAAEFCHRQKRLFLADGDVLALPFPRLTHIFHQIRKYLPHIKRIALYGSCRSINQKTVEELLHLKRLGLDRVYLGLESGSDEILHRVRKGAIAREMILAGHKIRKTGLFLSVTVLLGLGGKTLSKSHAIETARVLEEMSPNQIALLTLMVLDNTEMGRDCAAGKFFLPDSGDILAELYLLLDHLNSVKCQFHANHASTYLPLSGRLPKDRMTLLTTIKEAMDGKRSLVPEAWRAL